MSIYIPSHLLGRIPIKNKTDGKCPFISLSHEHDWNTNQKYHQATKFTKTEIDRAKHNFQTEVERNSDSYHNMKIIKRIVWTATIT